MTETAKEFLATGDNWTDQRARLALSVLLTLAIKGQTLTYGELEREIARRLDDVPTRLLVTYARILEKVGQSLNRLSDEWGREIPPLTILIKNAQTDQPSAGVNPFLARYIGEQEQSRLTDNNRSAMIERATNAVFNFPDWELVRAYFDAQIIGLLSDPDPIQLPLPVTLRGGEGDDHRALKEHIAAHPQLFKQFGTFGPGQVEFALPSGDEIDVLFRNDDQALAIEVKTTTAPPGELTRGLYQCVKYRAVLRAMYDIAGELVKVQAVLATPRPLPQSHRDAAQRLQIPTLPVKTE